MHQRRRGRSREPTNEGKDSGEWGGMDSQSTRGWGHSRRQGQNRYEDDEELIANLQAVIFVN